jgi:hypothetical protein
MSRLQQLESNGPSRPSPSPAIAPHHAGAAGGWAVRVDPAGSPPREYGLGDASGSPPSAAAAAAAVAAALAAGGGAAGAEGGEPPPPAPGAPAPAPAPAATASMTPGPRPEDSPRPSRPGSPRPLAGSLPGLFAWTRRSPARPPSQRACAPPRPYSGCLSAGPDSAGPPDCLSAASAAWPRRSPPCESCVRRAARRTPASRKARAAFLAAAAGWTGRRCSRRCSTSRSCAFILSCTCAMSRKKMVTVGSSDIS